ncbi:MAG: class I SAM-dependent methyltransferase [Planctomycetia bacterium]|nr:class I SAM-dependent methyltransferase [Planctomycetia bacterium]
MSEHIKKVYSFYSWIYDAFFGKIFEHGRYVAFHMMNVKANETILEVGVGTGLSLPLYPKNSNVIGIDISQEMLDKAETKKQYYRLSNVDLYNMNATSMTFADNTFDKVIASHVITVVPDPLYALNEIKRVCKKDGEIFILNYTGCNNKIISRFEEFISPFRDKMGLGKHVDLDELLRCANISILSERRVNF